MPFRFSLESVERYLILKWLGAMFLRFDVDESVTNENLLCNKMYLG